MHIDRNVRNKPIKSSEDNEVMNFNHKKLTAQLRRHEGKRLTSYQDSEGVWTSGFGRNLQAMTITESQASEWLEEDIKTAAEDLENAYPFVKTLSEVRQQVLVNMCFNLGITRLKKFKRMWAALEAGYYGIAALEMYQSKWRVQVGTRADELISMMQRG